MSAIAIISKELDKLYKENDELKERNRNQEKNIIALQKTGKEKNRASELTIKLNLDTEEFEKKLKEMTKKCEFSGRSEQSYIDEIARLRSDIVGSLDMRAEISMLKDQNTLLKAKIAKLEKENKKYGEIDIWCKLLNLKDIMSDKIKELEKRKNCCDNPEIVETTAYGQAMSGVSSYSCTNCGARWNVTKIK